MQSSNFALFLISLYLVVSGINAINFEHDELCLVKRNFTVATCGLKPEIEDVKDTLKKMENEISSLKSELNQVKEECGRRVHREAKDCSDLYSMGVKESGVYKVDPDGFGSFNVLCDMSTSGGGWTVFQRRFDGSVDFYRGWQDYKNGFGTLYGEHWLGLQKIHRITAGGTNKLRIELEDFEGNTRYASYGNMSIASEGNKFKLTIGSYSGTAQDALSYHNNMAFTTKDSDNDLNSGSNCAVAYKGAWWYRSCHFSNLNSVYYKTASAPYGTGLDWYQWKGYYYSLKKATMKIRVS